MASSTGGRTASPTTCAPWAWAVLGAYAHQDLPFEKLVAELAPQRDLSRQPLFQVMFVLQNTPGPPLRLAGLEVSPIVVDNGTAKFDLTLYLDDDGDGLRAQLEYNRDLFDRTTILRLFASFRSLLEGIAADPQRHLSELPLMPPAARWQLVGEWNDTATSYRAGMLMHQLFAAQAGSTPEAVAVVRGEDRLSYRELNRRANRLAHHLRSLGVEPEELVGLCMERSPAMVVGILAILKAGGAYLPLDPGYPQERLAFMLEDAGVRVLLSEMTLLAAAEALPRELVDGADGQR